MRCKSTINQAVSWVTTAIILTCGAGCANSGKKQAADQADPGPCKTLLVATDAAFPPFHYVDEKGCTTGHDVELAWTAAWRAGYSARAIVVRPYADLFTGLIEGKYDMVAATTGITPERQALYEFSDPYYETCQAVVVRIGAGEPSSLAALRGKKVGASGDGTSMRAVRGMAGVVPVQLETGAEAVPALRSGKIDALVIDEFEAVAAARADAVHLRVLPEPAALEQYAIVFRKDRGDLRDEINTALRAMQADGTAEKLRKQFKLHRDAEWPVRMGK